MNEERVEDKKPISTTELLARAEAKRPIIEHSSGAPRSRRTLGIRYAEVRTRSEVGEVSEDIVRRTSLTD